jgi:hypothetical protein
MRPLQSASVKKGLRVLTRIVLGSDWTLLSHNPRLHLIHMQDLLLRFLSSIELLASASQGFAINRQMHVPLTWLRY